MRWPSWVLRLHHRIEACNADAKANKSQKSRFHSIPQSIRAFARTCDLSDKWYSLTGDSSSTLIAA